MIKLCNDNNFEACNRLGVIFYNGIDPMKKNISLSRIYFQKACDGGMLNSCSSIAFSLLANNPNDNDIKKAINIQHLLCKKGMLDECRHEAKTYLLINDFHNAIEKFKFNCNVGDGYSCEELINLFKTKNIKYKSLLNFNDDDILALLKKGCNNKIVSPSACYTLLEERRTKLTKDEIKNFSFISCKHGYLEHCRDDDPEAKGILEDWLNMQNSMREQFEK